MSRKSVFELNYQTMYLQIQGKNINFANNKHQEQHPYHIWMTHQPSEQREQNQVYLNYAESRVRKTVRSTERRHATVVSTMW